MQKFVDSSKLKRHYLTHTGQKDFVCPHPGCGKVITSSFSSNALTRYHGFYGTVDPLLLTIKIYLILSKLYISTPFFAYYVVSKFDLPV